MYDIVAATSFNKTGYNEYGKAMVESFKNHWPGTVKLCVYLDDPVEPSQEIQSNNIEYLILSDQDLGEFKQRHQHTPEAHGLGKHALGNGQAEFKHNAVKFSHKVFALLDMIKKEKPEIAIWLDGDSRTHSEVTVNTIKSWCPPEYFAGFLARPWLYTETGFHIFRTKHSVAEKFFETWKKYYIEDTVFELEFQTDCHTYDAARCQFDQKLWFNLSPDFDHPHPFINGVLGEVMDHMKGPRKQKGTSHRKDLAISRSGYWKTIT